MKVKILISTVVLFLVGAGVGAALAYHIEDAAAALKGTYQSEIEAYQSGKSEKIKNDVSDLTQGEIERLELETREYLQQQLNSDYQDSLNEKSAEIQRVTDEKIQEIKNYIDGLLSAK
ncbi:hypothetical protein [Bacillus sp. FJAT-50079]|uniref:hypothetical protein n=1 Tax=Bacillus sp. FJAT-50079 TaxID=2833577 RepID=UPI001BCA442D|nr:hypothetical protein [Bacillus sp. FJAT-50079]MBS4207504.1 hypothetical protein [Bacillus sp. FJAT-50079]